MTPAEQNRITADGRARPRGWWHAEARAMSRRGVPGKDIAAHFDVCPSTVCWALRPDYQDRKRQQVNERRAKLRMAGARP